MSPFGNGTYNGYGDKPYTDEKSAYLSHYSSSSGQYTDHETGQVFMSERAAAEARWDRQHRGW